MQQVSLLPKRLSMPVRWKAWDPEMFSRRTTNVVAHAL